jgi:hypothetical protein
MSYILIKPDAASVYPYTLTDLQRDNPETSFPSDMTNFDPTPWYCYPVQDTTPPATDYTQNLTMGEPVLIDGVWTQTWIVTPASPEEIAAREDSMRQGNKQQASALLSESDYTDLPNTANKILNLPAILAYREALRVIALNPPLTVGQWPTKPKTEWSAA